MMHTIAGYLFAYGLGIFSAICAMLIGRYIGQRQPQSGESK